jgi:hypothetical protein
MFISISQEISRQYREEIMHRVATARQAGTTRLSLQRSNPSPGAGTRMGARALRGSHRQALRQVAHGRKKGTRVKMQPHHRSGDHHSGLPARMLVTR